MTQRIVIDPVTRIEGHAKISIVLGNDGEVESARFHVTEFRGFEKMCEGRPFHEMPGITARVCGICPVSHLIASAKAGDQILSVTVPPAAEKLRRLINLAQIVQSHALSFFHLSSPDLVLGLESPAEKRNLFGLIAADPEYARGGIRLRQFGQRVIELLGGKRIHPSWAVPGGVSAPLSAEGRREIAERVPEAKRTALAALERFKRLLDGFGEEVEVFGRFSTLFLGLVGSDGSWEHYRGELRLIGATGRVVNASIDPNEYQEYLAESVDKASYMKPVVYRPLGFPDGVYRVGPLARVNLCARFAVPEADRELREYRDRYEPPQTSSFLYHYARLLEILAGVEHIALLLEDPELESDRVRAQAGVNRLEGVGVSEAPRGTLFHHYRVDENGLIQRANLLIATGQNHSAMNRTLEQIARRYVKGPSIPEGILNRIEAGIRAFDPCLSCSTHAAGAMPLEVVLVSAQGAVYDRVVRGANG
jgi:NAD-reducing hydrogenase large subunit